MAVTRKPYELSVWREELKGVGQKEEHRIFIIGAHDMTHLGRAGSIKLKTKINGTHELTFQMVGKYFDSEKGEFVENPFAAEVYAERKIKLHYKNQWFEFFVKTVKEDKKIRGLLRSYTCTDAFIDELSRNGYGITFDEELYNNVEEIGTFTEEILEDSLWYYEPKNNWGDFTEYIEDKLYKIPVSQFNTSSFNCYKLNFNTNSSSKIENIFTGETRAVEMGDDLARVEGKFWDQKDGNNKLTANTISMPANDGYIYIPYSCLDFCYVSTDSTDNTFDIAATEVPAIFENDKTYKLAPPSVNPNYIIQFYAIPTGKEIEIDEAGLILDKNYIYFMTLDQWNSALTSQWYIFKEKEVVSIDGVNYSRLKKQFLDSPTDKQKAMGNRIVCYEGYLSEWNNINIVKGKKIQISDRTEINISEEIDQYTTIYNNSASDYSGLYTNEDWTFNNTADKDYRVCSKLATRQIVPQLARNFVQNGTNIQSIDGWEAMDLTGDSDLISAKVQYKILYDANNTNILGENVVDRGMIYFSPPMYQPGTKWVINDDDGIKYYYQRGDSFYTRTESNSAELITYTYKKVIGEDLTSVKKKSTSHSTPEPIYPDNSKKIQIIYVNTSNLAKTIVISIPPASTNNKFSFINFGAVAQEKVLEKGKIYCLGLAEKHETGGNIEIKIGEGSLISSNEYKLNGSKTITIPRSYFNYNNIPFDSWSSLENDGKVTTDNLIFTNSYILFSPKMTIKNPYIVISSTKHCVIGNLELFEAYTKGTDQFPEDEASYKYSGRNLIIKENDWNSSRETEKAYFSGTYTKEAISKKILFEDDIMPGDTHEYQQYYIQRLLAKNQGYDTMGVKEFLSSENSNSNKLPLDAASYTEEDYEIQTNYINLDACGYYNQNAEKNGKDCSHSKNKNGICLYQLYGYCPYRFQAEKHCRKIRTLKGEKSNRFNLTQELSKVFECYPIYYTEHDSIGRTKIKEDGTLDKRIFFIREKGNENLTGFKYHKNLSDISRTIKSEKIVTKLYVQDVDSDISRTGLCSIKTAEDNPSKDSFILDLSYYTAKGMLDKDVVEQDLYGIKRNKNDPTIFENGYLKTLGFYNTQYDNLSNQINYLSNQSYTELEANLNVNLDGIETAMKQLRKYALTLEKYKNNKNLENSKLSSSTAYNSYRVKYSEQEQILNQLIIDTFYTNGIRDTNVTIDYSFNGDKTSPINWIRQFDFTSTIREKWLGNHTYTKGILGQFNREFLQIQAWKKERASYLKKINDISNKFFKKYEPYLKEGTWSDSNYLTDNAYYHGALEVAAEGAIPSVQYTIKVIDISPIPGKEDYEINVADTSFIEDEEMFGIDKHSGFPNKFKILVSELNEDLDSPSKNSITVQNFTTQFEDLFKQVTASVQSLQFNQNIYKRSSNFTALQNVEEDSLQGTLDSNNLTLLSTSENNIQLDAGGQRGSDINNHANQYQLDGQGLQFSNNGGQSWNVGVGPSGINADYIKVGTLDASKVRIVDGNYVYFTWDKNGIAAYRNPESATSTNDNINDFALFNKYGLSIIKQNKVRLRAGYSYAGSDGSLSTEKDCGEDIGFYLYDNNGNSIFQTYTDSNEYAKLRLRGEIYATDADLNSNNGSIGIYLNNSSRQSAAAAENRRLFSVVYSPKRNNNENNDIYNIFSVLRDKVYIGGRILNATSVDNLRENLTIISSGIEFKLSNDTTHGFDMYMDFDSFKNNDSNHYGQSLSDYVTNQSYSLQTTKMDSIPWHGWNTYNQYGNQDQQDSQIANLTETVVAIRNYLINRYVLDNDQIIHN